MVERVNWLKDESGYSLVEVMVAIMLLTLAIVPMIGMFDAGLRAAVLGSNYDQARALAGEKLAEVQARPYGNTPDPAPNTVRGLYPPGSPRDCTASATDSIDPLFTCRVEITYVRLGDSGVVPDPNARTMMQVEVTVSWDSNDYSTTGLIAKGSE